MCGQNHKCEFVFFIIILLYLYGFVESVNVIQNFREYEKDNSYLKKWHDDRRICPTAPAEPVASKINFNVIYDDSLPPVISVSII